MRGWGSLRFAAALAATLLLAAPAAAQPTGSVDCGNDHYCPQGNACLLHGLCGRVVPVIPGSVRTSTGSYCDPGFRENKYQPGRCVPPGYTECPTGGACPPGERCSGDGACVGGPPPTGPVCGAARCAAGRICSSRGTCVNTEFFQDCGNGTICSKHAACEHPRGCVAVAPGRTRQIRFR